MRDALRDGWSVAIRLVAIASVKHLELSNWKIEEGSPQPGYGTNILQ